MQCSSFKTDSYKELSSSGFRSDNAGQSATTTHQFDANGFLVGITDSNSAGTTPNAPRSLVNDAAGHVLFKTQDSHVLKQLLINGQSYGNYGQTGDGTSQTNFNPNYQPITSSYPAAGAGLYPVRSGDTLQSIAQSAYGDSQQWYLIAQANGLSGNQDLRVGQSLNIPSRVGSVHNTAGTFRPYDPSSIVGSTSPDLPVPQAQGGGGLRKRLHPHRQRTLPPWATRI
jgi:LysM repeat protein